MTRLARGENLLHAFLADRQKQITAAELPPLAGTLRFVFSNALGFDKFVCTRLNHMMGVVARAYPDPRRKPPAGFCPSPALPGEDRALGEALLRLGLEVAWRFATLEGGADCWKTLEQNLPTWARDCYPGQESSETLALILGVGCLR